VADVPQLDLIAPTPARYYGRGQECDRCGWREDGHPGLWVIDDVTARRWCGSCCDAAGVVRAAPRTSADLELDDGRPRRVR